ncbi:RHS repeat-associated core domain-containing protein [Chryseobacterium sp. Leaf201]|uniref:RHS repeat-associated core domain-containing protein n=1 Tax=Chryseobacterium sp. Leaf201 TaxID=1735672 RepID=UPI0007124253|nr:RHS repeat-associated core domain-containing protein [Chryseobacterium sp. Leaf201]KQM19908.1 hypothetical protein ASE55_18605 [Chryseobacterium sp. Leaf201]
MSNGKDAQGNYTTYEYSQPLLTANIAILSSIKWGGNETLGKVHFNEVLFDYMDRDYIERSYVKGFTFIQGKMLSLVTVKTGGSQFKKYEITYKKDNNDTKYQFVDKITEYNSQNESANPAGFEYVNSSSQGWADKNYNFGQIENGVLGDFSGSGNLEFLRYQPVATTSYPAGLYLAKSIFDDDTPSQPVYVSNGTTFIQPTYLGNSISAEDFKNGNPIAVNYIKNNTIYNKQGFVLYKKKLNSITSKNDLELRFYTINNNQLTLDFTKTIPNSIYDRTEGSPNPHTPGVYNVTTVGKIRDMDLDGDGLSEIILELSDKDCEKINTSSQDPNFPTTPIYTSQCTWSKRYMVIETDQNSQSPNYQVLSFSETNADIFEDYKIGDFNGDGIQDMIRIDANKMPYLITFGKDNTGHYTVNETAYNVSIFATAITGVFKKAVIGDYNGDGKSDILTPQSDTTSDWNLYFSTGNNFQADAKSNLAYFLNNDILVSNNDGSGSIERTQQLSYDVNNDGKSDLISLKFRRVVTKQENFTATYKVNYYTDVTVKTFETTGVMIFPITGVSTILTNSFAEGPTTFTVPRNPDWPNPNVPTRFDLYGLVGDFRLNKLINKLVLISATSTRIKYYNFYDVAKEARIKSVTQGGIKTEIEYKQLDQNIEPNFYNAVQSVNYPFVEMTSIFQDYAVSQIKENNRKQDFKYRGYIANLNGRGSAGFRQTARSSWYADGFENTKIWSGVEIDPINYSVPVKEWSIHTNDDNKIFPPDISENNTQLLTFKSTNYKIDNLVNGQAITGSVPASDRPKVVTAIVPKIIKKKDFLKNIITNTTIDYGSFYLPSLQVTDTNNSFSTEGIQYLYSHNPSGIGKDYFIGRLNSKSESNTVSSYGSTIVTKEDYTYENDLLKTLKKWNRDNSGYLQETYTYDGFGNITQKITDNSVDSQTKTTKAFYDDKGRFVTKRIDNLGLETNINYNNLGQVITETDPLQNTITNTYDNWGKLLTSKNNLSGTTAYEYLKDNDYNITVVQYDPDGDITKKYTSKFGLEYKTSFKAFAHGQFISKQIQYDILDRKISESEPYFGEQSNVQWNNIVYDDSVFPAKITVVAFNGKQIETIISGATTTIKELNGYVRTTSKTTDALENVISSTDKGGTVTFLYNAVGQKTQAKYAENIVTTKYDVWGRKSEFNDPSNGVYKYEYDGFGQTKKIISPKGTKEYTYNNVGQLISQKELSTADGGHATNKLISYTYNDKGRITSKGGTSKGKTISSNLAYDAQGRLTKGKTISSNLAYDAQGRLISLSENNNGKYYIQKGNTYDDKGRLVSYEKSLYSSGVMTKVNIENVYNSWNGELYQIKDKTSGKILWQITETNAKGQLLKAKLGEANINNTYDTNGFLSNVNHSSAVKPGILQITYSFDAIKNELKSRTTGGDFNIVESFDYDDNNRLVNWSDPVTGIKPTANRNVYDLKGRILENDQVGTIKYENSSKIYQPTGMTLNAVGENNYNNDLIQSIVYNENNDPVFINGMKGDVAFQYGLTGMRQRVTYGGNFNADGEGKYTKFYSEDGSFEIQLDNTTGAEKHVLYIGGTPYDSDIIYLKNYAESTGSYKFLHKDYLGSILAITDESGYTLEQRHFDAWGNVTHFQKGTQPVITDRNQINNFIVNGGLLLDRGYTSHEYFPEIGIIHMNGRLYDPLLRRFLNADQYIQDAFNTQNYNKYGYVLNNPLMYNDPNGEIFFLVAIGIAAVYGAIIGAGVAVMTYVIKGLFTGNWSGFGKMVLGGAIAGAMSGALNGIGAAIFQPTSAVLNNGTWGFLSNMVTQFVQDGKIDLSMVAASAIGAYIGNKLPNWKALGGKGFTGWIKNAVGELIHNSLSNGITGAVSSGFAAAFRGKNVWKGIKNGFEIGVYNGIGQSAFMIPVFGATTKLEGDYLETAENVARIENFDLSKVKFRKGGLYQLIVNREVTWGSNIAINDETKVSTIAHELRHYVQNLAQGWGAFQARGIYEQFLDSFLGVEVYNWIEYGEKFQESQAEKYEYFYKNEYLKK